MRFYALSLALLAVISTVCCEVFFEEKFDTGKSETITFDFFRSHSSSFHIHLRRQLKNPIVCVMCISSNTFNFSKRV